MSRSGTGAASCALPAPCSSPQAVGAGGGSGRGQTRRSPPAACPAVPLPHGDGQTRAQILGFASWAGPGARCPSALAGCRALVPRAAPGAGQPSWPCLGRGAGLQAGRAAPRAPALSRLQQDKGGSAVLDRAHPEPRGPFGVLGARTVSVPADRAVGQPPGHGVQEVRGGSSGALLRGFAPIPLAPPVTPFSSPVVSVPPPWFAPLPMRAPAPEVSVPDAGRVSLVPLSACSPGTELAELSPCPVPTLSCPSVPSATALRHAGGGAVRVVRAAGTQSAARGLVPGHISRRPCSDVGFVLNWPRSSPQPRLPECCPAPWLLPAALPPDALPGGDAATVPPQRHVSRRGQHGRHPQRNPGAGG